MIFLNEPKGLVKILGVVITLGNIALDIIISKDRRCFNSHQVRGV